MFLIQYPCSDSFLITDWLTENFTEEAIIWIQPCVYTYDSCLSLTLNNPKLWLWMPPCFSGPNICKSHALTSLGKVQKPGRTQRSVFISFKNIPAFHHSVGLVVPVNDETNCERTVSLCTLVPVAKCVVGGDSNECGHRSVTGWMNLLQYCQAEPFRNIQLVEALVDFKKPKPS